jgi:hypothetical protein
VRVTGAAIDIFSLEREEKRPRVRKKKKSACTFSVSLSLLFFTTSLHF